jgi:hypothetical protein
LSSHIKDLSHNQSYYDIEYRPVNSKHPSKKSLLEQHSLTLVHEQLQRL